MLQKPSSTMDDNTIDDPTMDDETMDDPTMDDDRMDDPTMDDDTMDDPTVDDDSQFYEGNGEGGDASNQYSVPLIPTEFTSIDEAMQNFTVVFESRYFPYRLKMNENLYTNKLSLVLCTS